ncbi:conserved hypothetical protein [Talaromyces stipitatus ATCC 10500]|uniref:Azaphilone pigments biosynthesis cluster protein L N-terminal domain-containing protein n=1 Tax=Talaromyces stipitatus (strain ATCC 10500 / CBS 375.48 / QM 6759 / NRRL 1006) TaxID=441959 RepID=B8MLR8_TALSN|nr:uncharacterized protein TSTA_098950 [Talaromyces stipitatus ATCC 10500]EED13640.1 conserved hypothetical protein [Talaromyces stipitatus ATCC 10500]
MDPFSITVGAIGITEAAISSIHHLCDLIGSLADAKETVQDIAIMLEGVQRPLAALEELQIPNQAMYTEAKSDLEKTGIAEAVNKCGQACADFTKKFQQWTKHSSNTHLSLRDRLSVGVWNKERIRTFRTQIQSCRAIVQFAIESTQLLIQLRSEYTSKTDRKELKTRLRSLEKAVQEHISFTKGRRNEALERKEELQENLEDEEDGGAQRTLAMKEVEEQSRLLKADETASSVVSSQLRAGLSDHSGVRVRSFGIQMAKAAKG